MRNIMWCDLKDIKIKMKIRSGMKWYKREKLKLNEGEGWGRHEWKCRNKSKKWEIKWVMIETNWEINNWK